MRDAVTLPISSTNALNGRLSYPVPDIESHLCVSMNYLSFIRTLALKYKLNNQALFWTFFSNDLQLRVGENLSFSKIFLSFWQNFLSFSDNSLNL